MIGTLETKIGDNTNCFIRFYRRHTIICLLFVLSAVSFFVYKDFILLQKLFIYTDVASDSYGQTFPTLSYISGYVKDFGYPWWSFNMGLGGNLYAISLSVGDPFASLTILLGKDALPYTLGIVQAAKPVFAGLFFYLFLRKSGRDRDISFIVAILYAFCGHMIGRGAWFSYPNEVVWVAFVLYAIERYLMDSNYKLLPIAVAVFFLSQKGYQGVLYTLYFFVFVLIRYFSIHKFSRRDFAIFILKYIGLFVLGMALAAVLFLPSLMNGFQSARIADYNSETEALSSSQISGVIGLKEFFTVFYRTISIDALGTGSNYTGMVNYLEDPLFYCGTISLLLLPQAFFIADKRKRNAVIIMLALASCYIVFPFIRYALNGFTRETYKASSFIIIVMMLFACAMALENMICKKNIHIKLLCLTFAGVAGITIGGILLDKSGQYSFNFDFDPGILFLSGIFLFIYFLIFLLYRKSKALKKLIFLILTAAICIETGIFAFNSVNNRGTLGTEFVSQKISYNDYTNEAVEYLNTIENNSFYRLETDYSQGFLCASLYQNFYGVKSYTLQAKETLSFLNFVNAGLTAYPTNYVFSFNNRYALNSLLGVKYLLSLTDTLALPGYELIGKVEDIYIFKNTNAFSLGVGYSQYVYAGEMKNAGNTVRDLTLLQAVAVEDGAAIPEGMNHFDILGLESKKSIVPIDSTGLTMNGIQIISSEDDKITFQVMEDEGAEIRIPMPAGSASISEISFSASSDEKSPCIINWLKNNEPVDTVRFETNKGEKAYNFSIPSADTCQLTLTEKGIYTIGGIETSSLPQELYVQALAGKGEMMNVTEFSQNRIKGETESQGNRILYLSIPFDRGWSAEVDGSKADIMVVDRGLMGINLTEGKHSIELSYTPPYLYAGSILSAIGAIIYIILLARRRQKKTIGQT